MTATVVLHSALSPEEVAEALRRSMDAERGTLFSLSGYRGSRAVLGEVQGDSFRMQQRMYTRNDFAGQFYGRFHTEEGALELKAISPFLAGQTFS